MKTNGQLRICGDFKITVNPILRHCALVTLEPEDLFMKLNDYSRFSKIDLENAFLQVLLNADSQELTTINMSWSHHIVRHFSASYQFNSRRCQ